MAALLAIQEKSAPGHDCFQDVTGPGCHQLLTLSNYLDDFGGF